MYSRGDLLLIPVPFSDLSSNKRRPVLVLSEDAYNAACDDILVAAVTSNVRERAYSVPLNQEHLTDGILPKSSCIRADKLYSLANGIVIKRIGHIDASHMSLVRQQIIKLISPNQP